MTAMIMRLSYSGLNTKMHSWSRFLLPAPLLLSQLIVILAVAMASFAQTPQYRQGFPFVIDTTRSPTLMNSSTPLITDLDNDGKNDIVFFVLDYLGQTAPFGRIHAVNYEGNELQGFPRGYDESIISLASGDLNNDGKMDLVMRLTNTIDAIDITGNHLPGFPIFYSDGDAGMFKPISLYDLDNDELPEIIACKYGEICVFNSDGTIRQGWPRYVAGYCRSGFAVGNIDNTGDAEILAPTLKWYTTGFVDSSAIRIYRSNGENFSSDWPVYSDSTYYNWGSMVSIQINKNNPDSTHILMTTKRREAGAFTMNRANKYNLSGNLVARGFSYVMTGAGTLSIGDLDRDGKVEFTNGSQGNPTYLNAYSNTMIRIPGYWPQEGVGEYITIPCIGKLTYANRLNIIDNNWFQQVTGFGYVFAYEANGNELPWSPFRPVGLVYAVSLADLNNDGSAEIIFLSSHTSYETYLHVLELSGIPFNIENFPWPMTSHDRYRTNQYGFIPPDEPVGIQPISNVVPEKFELHQNYPNPFNPSTTIRFDVRTSGNVSLKVFDVLGREVAVLADEYLRAGSYERVFEASNLSSGVYFYTLRAGEFEKTLRMVVVR